LLSFHVEEYIITDSIFFLNHAPVVLGSVAFRDDEGFVPSRNFKLNYISGEVRCLNPVVNNIISVSYRSYAVDFSKVTPELTIWERKKEISDSSLVPHRLFNPKDHKKSVVDDSRLNVRGSIARGLNVGNNQNAVLNSNLNMQIEGDLGGGLMVRASISDRNIPIQADGTTQQLQEFDQVFIEVYNRDFKLTAGDFNISQNKGVFLKYNRKSQGALLETEFSKNKDFIVKSRVGGAVAKGKYNRMEFLGQEGNQGPYKMTGANNEMYIVILSGSERVFLDGELLSRGQSRDYIIDYNTGEIVFTASQLITKDSRIIAEFEYSDRNYNRFMLVADNEIKTKNASYFVRYFSDADAKNQPVDQDIDTEKRTLLSGIGDDLNSALYPSIDSVGFMSGQVRYKMTDTIFNGQIYDSIFVYSVNPDSAVYQVGFSLVGENLGDYKKLITSANGKVYEWIAPVNGLPQGEYAPVSMLITPKKERMLSLGGENKISENSSVFYEFAFSKEDVNLYSKKDSEDDNGLALRTGFKQDILKSSTHNLKLKLYYDFIHENFQAVENFREPEFERDWNLGNLLSDVNEHSGQFNINYDYKDKYSAEIKTSVIYRPEIYVGYKYNLTSDYSDDKWKFYGFANLLSSRRSEDQSNFIKHKLRLGRRFNSLEFFVEEYQEKNIWETSSDSLLGESFKFQEIKAWINQGVGSRSKWKISYKYRKDDLPYENKILSASESHDIKANLQLVSQRKTQISSSLSYRKLDIINGEVINSGKSQNNLAGQIRFNNKSFNDFLQTILYYESAAGLELKKEFTYLEVPAGQGVYVWTDYNGNGVEDLDEFEIAQFNDQAKYIRIYTPTSEYIRTYNNSLSLSINMRPEKLFNKDADRKNFISRFSNQLSLNLSDKNTSDYWYERYLPVTVLQADTSLVYLNNYIRNVLSFNRFSSVFTSDFIYQNRKSNSLLVSGLERQASESYGVKIRWNLSRVFSFHTQLFIGDNQNDSEFFTSKNYFIEYERTEISLSFQPNINMRYRLYGEFNHKENLPDNVYARNISPGFEYTNNALGNGMLNVRLKYTFSEYNGETNSSLAYQMLEGLLPGHNFTWNVSFQKRLSNGLQINLNYQGRKPAYSQIVHTGGVQLRAYF
jgi:hypothetical protein